MEKVKNQDTQETPQIYERFPLKPDLFKGLKDCGYLDPFIAKENILVPILQGKDLYAESEPCLEKSLAIIVAALQRIESDKKYCQVIIIMPTRELCLQAVERAKQIGKYMNDLNVVAIYGGGGLFGLFDNDQIKLRKRHSILIATPGKLLNAIEKEYIELKWLKLLILDEADQVLGSYLKDKVLRILKLVPSEIQMAIFSANQYVEVRNLIDHCLRDPVFVQAEDSYMDMKSVTHYKVNIENQEDKVDFLRKYYRRIVILGKRPSIVFCKKVEDLEKLVKVFREEKFNVHKLDHSMSHKEKFLAVHEFFMNDDQILITIDFAFFDEMKAKSTVTLIINYDVPARKQDYQMNFGRMKKFPKRQIAINLVTQLEAFDLEEIETFYGIQMKELPSDVMM